MQPNQTRAMPKRSRRQPDLNQLASAIRKGSRQLCREMELQLKELRAEPERSRLNVKRKSCRASRPVTLSQDQLAASAASTSGKI